MLYSLYDLETMDYLATGRNSKTIEELKEDLTTYMWYDIEAEDREEWAKLPLEEICEQLNYRIDAHNKPIPE